jgi:hypothetical protein
MEFKILDNFWKRFCIFGEKMDLLGFSKVKIVF